MGGTVEEPKEAKGWKEKIMVKMLYAPATRSEYNY
jgi:hypothetical protein